MSRTFSKGGYEVKINTTVARKLQYCLVYIKVNTKEKELLFALSNKYKVEKLMPLGGNANNEMYSVIPGPNGVVIGCPENKIVPNIMQYLAYLGKAELKKCQNCYLTSKVSYDELMKGLKSVSVEIVGKCKTFKKNCIDKSGSPKMDNMMRSISTMTVKSRKDAEPPKEKCECKTMSFKCSDSQAVDVIVSFKDCPIVVKRISGGIEVECCCCGQWNCYSDVLRGYLKSFKSQCGNYGTPSANDKGGKNYKIKCDEIFEGVNKIAEIISDVRGCKVKYSKQDDLKAVDSESVRMIIAAEK